MTSSCLFCRVVAREVPADVVYEDDDLIAFSDIHPKYPVHVLLIPKIHLASVREVKEEHEALMGKMLRVAGELADQRGISESGFRVLMNTGPDAGQAIAHLHVHLLGGERLRAI